MKVVVALGGNLADTALVRARVGGAELVIAADSGADRLRRLGLQPHAVIGDFDSLAADRIEALRTSGVEIVPHPEPQYRTDGQVALELAASRGASEVILLGVRGGPRRTRRTAGVRGPLDSITIAVRPSSPRLDTTPADPLDYSPHVQACFH